MLDIVEIPEDGRDLGVADSVVPKAANVIGTQIGDLEYEPTFGVDLRFFLASSFQFQNESFKAYLIDRLTQSEINVTECLEIVGNLSRTFSIGVNDADNNSGGFIA